MTSTEHSIWLMPSGEVRYELALLIAKLATEYSTEVFPPHVTLIGRLAHPVPVLDAKARQLAARLKPYELALGNVEYLDEYYRCLFTHLQETEAVLHANAVAREVFGRQDDPTYMPHMSLLYGDFPKELKDKIIDKIGRRIERKFQATSIYLYSTFGKTRDWYCVGEYPLGDISK